jgi:hypothetical protein
MIDSRSRRSAIISFPEPKNLPAISLYIAHEMENLPYDKHCIHYALFLALEPMQAATKLTSSS